MDGSSRNTLPEEIREEIENFEGEARAFLAGQRPDDVHKPFRLMHGIYGQRQAGASMIRVKLPSGIVSDDQLRCLADIANKYSNGVGHITTRQNIQFHYAKLERVSEAMGELAAAGMTTREACGNAIRNVATCPFAGACADEAFDVTPYALETTAHFLRNPVCQKMPRKFKIAFSGCASDCGQGAINDIGCIATSRTVNGKQERGFTIKVGGGLSFSPQDAWRYEEFIPIGELLPVCEAIVRVFVRDGNYVNRKLARMKFLIRELGFEEWKRRVAEERAKLSREMPIQTALPSAKPATVVTEKVLAPANHEPWLANNTRPEKNPDVVSTIVSVPLGDLTSDQFRDLADIVEKFGNGLVRTTNNQNLVMQSVPRQNLSGLHAALTGMGLGVADGGQLIDIAACPGAHTCNLAITRSKSLADDLRSSLQPMTSANGALKGVTIKISGCPNSCGQHHVATIGLHGGNQTIQGRKAPHYMLLLGGGIDERGARFGTQTILLPARRVKTAIQRIVDLYTEERQKGETFEAFTERLEAGHVIRKLEGLRAKGAHIDEEVFLEPGSDTPFVFVGVGKGECAS